jgi:D-alanyl-lipoteichoic acid acyltransferase DltB (MBOAT superfamily)
MPYLACNVTEFWHRWHISLSTWLRDYLFIPLGGSRRGTWLTARNLLLTMVLGGLWHGASWTFVLWGSLHGGMLIAHRTFATFCKSWPRFDRCLQLMPFAQVRWSMTFVCVSGAWILFRAESLHGALALCRALIFRHGKLGPPLPLAVFYVSVTLVMLAHWAGRNRWWPRLANLLPAPAVGLTYAIALSLVLLCAPDIGQTFIYFQF